jgi:UDPglucose--hexose-1-phosphate uridylyltransferase
MDNPAGSQRFDLASCRSPAWGWHEVIIEAREHVRQMTELSVGHVEQIFSAYRARLAAHRKSPGCRAAMIFKNSGRDAGMSREHLHSQLVALSATPPLIALELAGAESFRAAHAQCVFCYLADQARECQPARVIVETATLVAYCPFASRTAFEVWVQPREHAACFDVTSDKCLAELAQLVPDILRRLQCHLGSFAYNYVLHTLPFDTRREDHYHWHIEIIPRTSRLAGLEWGSGILVNTMAPEEAAARLRGVEFADQVELTSGEEKTSEKN